MEFKQTTIAPAGRNKYGNYLSSGNVTKSVVSTTYAGNNTTTTIGDTGTTEDVDKISFYCILSKSNVTFDAIDLVQGITEETSAIAYRGSVRASTYICDMDAVSATTGSDGIITGISAPNNMGVIGIPEGMTVSFRDNGTSATTIVFNVDNAVTGNTGTISIPVNVYKRAEATPNANDLLDWYDSREYCEQVWLDYVWNVNRAAASNYIMDLSNERAGVNVSATTASGDILFPNSIAALTCTATTHMNGELVTGVTYSKSTQPRFNARGNWGINPTTGEMYWESNFNFDGPTLPIDIIATIDGEDIATKTMTIEKNYPGADGQAAVTRWIVTSHDAVHYNPNSNVLNPSVLSAWVMTQVGGEEPEIDATTATTIYYGYDTSTPTQPLTKNAQGVVTARTYYNTSSTTFALKTSQGVYYEVEEVPTLWDGVDGTDGTDGTNGIDGESAWYLSLDNDNASINADASGNIYTNAIRPTCHGKLYNGQLRQTGATYVVDYGSATGITPSTSNGILTLNFGSNFNFTGDILQIAVSGYSGGEMKDVKYMNVTKSKAGADGENGENGEDAVSYWLEVSYGEIIYNPNTTTPNPAVISATCWMQRGEEAMVHPTDINVKTSWQWRSTGSFTSESQYTTGANINITQAMCVDYSRLRFKLYKGSALMDQEDVDILMNGVNGENGGQGRQGPAVRGPYDYYAMSASTQCWCAGASSSTCDDCDKWIDVIVKDDVYYYCNTTYYGKIAPWSTYQSYWTSGDTFDFVATNLLLAENAKIKFLSGNELYLMSGGTITGGAAGGSGYTFWAGAEDAANAPFTVDTGGNVIATKGTFGCFTIGSDGRNNSFLGSSSALDVDTKEIHNIAMNPEVINFNSVLSGDSFTHYESVSISPNRNPDKYDGCGVIDINFDGSTNGVPEPAYTDRYAVCTNGSIRASEYFGQTRVGAMYNLGHAVLSNLKIEIQFMTDSESLFQKAGNWYINGNDTGISALEPRSLFTSTYSNGVYTYYFDGNWLGNYGVAGTGTTALSSALVTGGTQYWHFNKTNLGINASYYPNIMEYADASNVQDYCYWVVYGSSQAIHVNTGIAWKTGFDSVGLRRNNVIYIEL